MKVSIVYLHIVTPNEGYDAALDLESGTYEHNAKRFVDTYREFPAGIEHELYVVFTNGIPRHPEIYKGLGVRSLYYKGDAWCTGVHQWAATQIESDFTMFSSARTFFWKSGWLKRIVEAREKYGEGIYGTMSSNEVRPHLRTNFYGINPEVLRSFPHAIASRGDTWKFESGDWNISHQFQREGKPAILVTWDGHYSFPDWRKPANIFRRGTQNNCLVFDRHTEIFDKASLEERERLANMSDGI